MKHVIIGTAGHVDHGKTELVKALTGVDTDRLAEEKKRGITIDLGFARLDFPDGSCASIVDVPGHERFIKNMLAGAGGVDLAMLVVAADEGFMPQTVEHLDILQLLGVKDGLIVLTKTDLVDEDWLNMLEEDVKSRVKGTFLEDKPILRTSVRTGEGVGVLREALHDLTLHAEEKSARTPFRLPIDRVFSVDGFGTIVTGTLIDGHIAVGDEAQLMPLGNKCRVRNLQVHGRDVSAVYAGQRAAVNLAGIKKESISRGDVLCRTDSMQPSLMLDVKLQNLPDSKRIIESGSRLHLYHGAAMRLVCSAATVAALWLLWRTAKVQAGCATTEAIRLGQMNRRLAMGLLGAMLLVASANAGWVVRHILSNPVTRFVSSVSMQFYICHQTLAVWLLRARIIPSVSATPNYDGELLWQKRYTFVCFAAALLLAALLTYGFERPVSRRLLGKNLLGKTGKKQKRA